MYREVSQNSLEDLETGQEAYTLLEEQKEEHGEHDFDYFGPIHGHIAQDLFPFKSRELSYSYIHEIKQRGMHGPQFTACKSGIASDHPLGVSQCIVRLIQYGATV